MNSTKGRRLWLQKVTRKYSSQHFFKKSYLLNDFNKKLNILTMLASVIPIYTGNMCEKKTIIHICLKSSLFRGLTFSYA